MNITELARKLKITPKELKQTLPELGFHIGPRAIQIPDQQAQKVIETWQEMRKKQQAVEKIEKKILKREELGEKEQEEVILLPPSIQVYYLAEKLGLPVIKVMNELVKNGVLCSVNENLDYEIAAIVSENLGFETQKGDAEEREKKQNIKDILKRILKQENKEKLTPRPPVVVVMGHVDHGKSSILDAIRESKIVEFEKGGITQHIGAYQVKKNNHLITFVDTPGHEAFKSMRARGGELADIAILVIAADDKIQPQTLESIKIIQSENIPFIIAINKIDKPDADEQSIKKQLSEINLMPEDWGGKIICVSVSAKTKKGIDNLLEMINLVAGMEKNKLLSNVNGEVVAVVVESHLDIGLGPVATLITYNGTLMLRDNVIIGKSYGKLRSMQDYLGKSINNIQPGLPVRVFGLKGVPDVGEIVQVIDNNKEFKKRVKQLGAIFSKTDISASVQPDEDEDLEVKKQKVQYLNLILRADVIGSLEAIVHSLEKLDHTEVKIKILKKGLGNLTEADVDLGKTTNATLVGFNVDITSTAKQLAYELGLKVNIYSVVYDLIQDIKQELNNLLPENIIEEKVGDFEVLKIFQTKGKQSILGGKVLKGKIIKDVFARVWLAKDITTDSKQELKGEGKIIQLQINKKDVDEVKSGKECGIKFLGKVSIGIGDILEIYKETKEQRTI